MATIGTFCSDIWVWIAGNAKVVCACFVTIIVAICSFFGNLFGLNKPPVETTNPSTSITSTATTTTAETTTETTTATTTETTTATTTETTTATTTATTTTQKAIPAFTITLIYEGELKIFTNANAVDLSRYTEAMSTTDSYGTVSNYSFTGVRLKDVLQLVGIPVNALPAGTTIHADATDGAFTDITLDLIKSDKTLLAWEQDGQNALPPRLCPGDSENASLYLKKINVLTINKP